MLSYRATLEIPAETAARVSRWIQAHRNRVDTRPWQRAATCWTQAMLALRWLKDDTKLHLLAHDAKISQATAYRYLHEAIDVIAEHAPDLHEVLAAGREDEWAFVCLDGTLIETSRSSTRSAAVDSQINSAARRSGDCDRSSAVYQTVEDQGLPLASAVASVRYWFSSSTAEGYLQKPPVDRRVGDWGWPPAIGFAVPGAATWEILRDGCLDAHRHPRNVVQATRSSTLEPLPSRNARSIRAM